jgi:hypothetical protein
MSTLYLVFNFMIIAYGENHVEEKQPHLTLLSLEQRVVVSLVQDVKVRGIRLREMLRHLEGSTIREYPTCTMG